MVLVRPGPCDKPLCSHSLCAVASWPAPRGTLAGTGRRALKLSGYESPAAGGWLGRLTFHWCFFFSPRGQMSGVFFRFHLGRQMTGLSTPALEVSLVPADCWDGFSLSSEPHTPSFGVTDRGSRARDPSRADILDAPPVSRDSVTSAPSCQQKGQKIRAFSQFTGCCFLTFILRWSQSRWGGGEGRLNACREVGMEGDCRAPPAPRGQVGLRALGKPRESGACALCPQPRAPLQT